jgi:hypothetical protein
MRNFATLVQAAWAALALPMVVLLIGGCAATTTASWGPGELKQRAFSRDRVLALCDFKSERREASAGEAAYSSVFQYALSRSGAFGFVTAARLERGESDGPVDLRVMAQQNNLHACLSASVFRTISVGFSKKVVLTTRWEVIGRDGWNLKIETQAKSKKGQGVFPDLNDRKMDPVFQQLAWENAHQFLRKLASQGMIPAAPTPGLPPPDAGPVPPIAADWIPKDASEVKAGDVGENEKLIVVAYYEFGARVPNFPVNFLYYDSKTRQAVAKTVPTDGEGLARLTLPAEPDGSSSVFAFGWGDKTMRAVRAGRATALRIPAATGAVKQIVFRIAGNLFLGNGVVQLPSNGPIQLMKFPPDGTDMASYGGGDVIQAK